MRSRSLGALACLALLAAAPGRSAAAADPPKRKPLTKEERAAVLTLIKAVDLAQETAPASEDDGWETHILKSTNYTAYLPFRLAVDDIAWKGAVVYIRAVSRRDGVRARDERSQAVGWLANGAIVPPRIQTV